jgi:hypothetical protein
MQAVAKVLKNVARVLQVTGRPDVPFYLGSDEPLLGDPIDAAFVRHIPLRRQTLLPAPHHAFSLCFTSPVLVHLKSVLPGATDSMLCAATKATVHALVPAALCCAF